MKTGRRQYRVAQAHLLPLDFFPSVTEKLRDFLNNKILYNCLAINTEILIQIIAKHWAGAGWSLLRVKDFIFEMKLGILTLVYSALGELNPGAVTQQETGQTFGNGLQLRETTLCKIGTGANLARKLRSEAKPPKVKKEKKKKDKTKKKKGGSSGVELDCSGLNLESLGGLPITGDEIEVLNAVGAKEMLKISTVTMLNLSGNQLSDGQELKDFVATFSAVNKISVKNNNFAEIPSDTFSDRQILALNLEENPLVTLPEGLLDTFSFNKKAGSFLKLPCEMKSVPVSIIKMLKNLQKYGFYCGKSFKQ